MDIAHVPDELLLTLGPAFLAGAWWCFGRQRDDRRKIQELGAANIGSMRARASEWRERSEALKTLSQLMQRSGAQLRTATEMLVALRAARDRGDKERLVALSVKAERHATESIAQMAKDLGVADAMTPSGDSEFDAVVQSFRDMFAADMECRRNSREIHRRTIRGASTIANWQALADSIELESARCRIRHAETFRRFKKLDDARTSDEAGRRLVNDREASKLSRHARFAWAGVIVCVGALGLVVWAWFARPPGKS